MVGGWMDQYPRNMHASKQLGNSENWTINVSVTIIFFIMTIRGLLVCVQQNSILQIAMIFVINEL